MYDTQKAAAAQAQYCAERNLPNFSPRSGSCYRCGVDIFRPIRWPGGYVSGITVEDAGSGHIVSCPHCRRSFCD